MMNVSERTLRDAKSILREGPEQAEAIERGEKTITQVRRELQREKVLEAKIPAKTIENRAHRERQKITSNEATPPNP